MFPVHTFSSFCWLRWRTSAKGTRGGGGASEIRNDCGNGDSRLRCPFLGHDPLAEIPSMVTDLRTCELNRGSSSIATYARPASAEKGGGKVL